MNNPLTTTLLSSKFAVSFSELLTDYIARRPEGDREFHLSEWLNAMDEFMLNRLDESIEIALSGNPEMQGVFFDLVRLCEIAVGAEKGRADIPRTTKGLKKVILNLQVLNAVICLSRNGLIKLAGPVALSSKNDFKFFITDYGRRAGVELGLLVRTR